MHTGTPVIVHSHINIYRYGYMCVHTDVYTLASHWLDVYAHIYKCVCWTGNMCSHVVGLKTILPGKARMGDTVKLCHNECMNSWNVTKARICWLKVKGQLNLTKYNQFTLGWKRRLFFGRYQKKFHLGLSNTGGVIQKNARSLQPWPLTS